MRLTGLIAGELRRWFASFVGSIRRGHGWFAGPAVLAAAALVLSAAQVYGGSESLIPAVSGPRAAPADVDVLLQRARDTERLLERAADLYEEEVEPIEQVLLQYRRDPHLARRIALSLVREAGKTGLDPNLLLAVLLVENPALDPNARSFVGAAGLMQVMPLHRGQWPGCTGDLADVETNICYGARIFADNLRRHGNVERALLGYNGCVRGTNTPNCHQYPNHVYARAGRATLQAWISTKEQGKL